MPKTRAHFPCRQITCWALKEWLCWGGTMPQTWGLQGSGREGGRNTPPTSDVLDKLTHELVTLSQGSQHAKRDSEFCQVLH